MDIRTFLKHQIVMLDGGMGTLLQQRGLKSGQAPERWCVSHPEAITEIHRAYFDAGANIVNTNTFGANRLHYSSDELEEIIPAAISCAKAARDSSLNPEEKFIALDIGPSGRLLKPMGDLDFEEAVSIFSEVVRIGARYGADLVMIETMNDCYETKAALLAAKESCDLPVFVSNAYSENGALMTGASPAAMVAMLEAMGADAIGVNCSFGPEKLAPVVREYLKYASVPVLLKPNAGMPKSENGKTVYDVDAEEFSDITAKLVEEGVSVAGGCCGTTPDYIRALKRKIAPLSLKQPKKKDFTVISSYTNALFFSDEPILIGEKINPTGKKRLKQALRENDISYILDLGLKQQSAGVHALDVNVGLPEIDEPRMLCDVVTQLQAVCDLPLVLDTGDIKAMESALRRYNGKALINSVNGKDESMKAVFTLMKKYGGVAIALTLDENGIPKTSDERILIAEKIISVAASYGIEKKDLVFDPLAMTVSADQNAANVTLRAVNEIRHKLGVHTSLGVSNCSFGLPRRDVVTAAFFTCALENGLSAAIMNPFSAEMQKAYHSFRVLRALDENCADYIRFAETLSDEATLTQSSEKTDQSSDSATLFYAVKKGLKEDAKQLTVSLLSEKAPLDIVTDEIIPALDAVGEGFEKGTVYLPSLLMSAEAAKAAFDEIKAKMPSATAASKCTFILATVKGDVNDIGKNIVRLLLENYGFDVIDLGKDVAPETILDETVKRHAPLVGLSALMTTTVVSMEETIRLLKEKAPWAKVVVGGAVLTQEYADSIGADAYCKDAMDTVRYSEKIYASL